VCVCRLFSAVVWCYYFVVVSGYLCLFIVRLLLLYLFLLGVRFVLVVCCVCLLVGLYLYFGGWLGVCLWLGCVVFSGVFCTWGGFDCVVMDGVLFCCYMGLV